MYREIAGTDEQVRAIPGVRDRRVRATKVRLYVTEKTILIVFMSIVYASKQHAKLPIVIKISVTLCQIVYIYMSAISTYLIYELPIC